MTIAAKMACRGIWTNSIIVSKICKAGRGKNLIHSVFTTRKSRSVETKRVEFYDIVVESRIVLLQYSAVGGGERGRQSGQSCYKGVQWTGAVHSSGASASTLSIGRGNLT